MQYTAVKIKIKEFAEDKMELLVALLDSLEFEGITELGSLVVGYIPSEKYDRNLLDVTLAGVKDELHAEICSEETVEDKNWNAEWEKNFVPVIIDNRCVIRAPFHEKFDKYEYVINIEPKMAFGTGHHETTSLMISALLDVDFGGKTVLDMGCGTGILGILAAMKGAKKVVGIDIDEWAYNNAIENARNNNTNITFLQGGAEVIPEIKFDIILANINRNILIEQSIDYNEHLTSFGKLFISGILIEDVDMVEATFIDLGLTPVEHTSLGNWQMLEFVK